MYRLSRRTMGTICGAVVMLVGAGHSALAVTTVINETFDVDPMWVGFDNRVPDNDFGWSNTNTTGAASGAGEIGGLLARDPRGYYAAETGVIDPATDVLSMSGTMYINIDATHDAEAYIGWFDNAALGGTATPSSFLGFRLQNDPPYEIRLLAQPASNNIFQQDVAQFGIGGMGDEIPFTFDFEYDPAAFFGQGEVTVSFNEGTPIVAPLPAGIKDGYSLFNHFGMISSNAPGSVKWVEVYMDDITYTANETVAFPLGDFDRNNAVNDADFDIMKMNWLTSGHAKNELGEVTGDGIIDLNDFKLFKEQLYAPGAGAGSGEALFIPEPSSLVLLGIAAPLLLMRRRHGRSRFPARHDG